MSKHTPHAHIAGEVAASGKRPASEVADRIIERLAEAGFVIVPVCQAQATKVLLLLDAAFDLSGTGVEGVVEILRSAADQPFPVDRAA